MKSERSEEPGFPFRGSFSVAATSAVSARRRRSSARGFRETRRPIMDTGWELGLTTFDTADATAAGAARRDRRVARTKGAAVRDTITIETKTFNPMNGRTRPRPVAGRIRRQLDRSLAASRRRAGRALHGSRARPETRRTRRHSRAFDELVQQARSAPSAPRTSTRATRRAIRLGARRPHTLRVGAELLSLLDRASRDRLPRVPRAGLGYEAFGPLAGGWLTGKYRRGQPFTGRARV